ncbi:MAG: TonB-dependent receptor [Dechloromonas sp.]|nr:TonB-dependent receptor [Dechloromonas sp.]
MFKPTPLTLALALAFAQMPISPATAADASLATAAPKTGTDEVTLPAIIVEASSLALGAEDMTTPTSVLEGKELILRRGATLGESLDGEPGTSATHFGAGASRPVIRGMDGARIRILSHGAEVMDASMSSQDHAVTVEPLLTRQIEILRGPSGLAYGGGAIGGVVNVLDDKIPTRVPVRGAEGHVELRGASANGETTGAFSVSGGRGNFAWHAEGLHRDTDNYSVGRGWSGGKDVDGSDTRSRAGSLGLSWIGERSYLGVAYTAQRNAYGLPGHSHDFEDCHTHGNHLHCGTHDPDDDDDHDHEEHAHGIPRVDLRSDRWDLRGEYLEPFSGFERVRFSAGLTDYRHDEMEDRVVATRFRNKARDGRLELQHHPLAGWRGIIGLQSSKRDFSALGEEAYIQPTVTQRHAIFLLEEKRIGAWRLEGALRHERQRIDVRSTQPDRSHHGTSASFGASWQFAPQYNLGLTLSRSQRLPSAEELYAEGLHLASATYERGNDRLQRETSNNIDLSLRKTAGPTTFTINLYRNRIANYIYANTLDEENGLQLIEYAQRDAVFTGVEASLRQQISHRMGITVFGDYVRARLTQGGDLPRIPAARLGTRLDATWNADWRGELEFYRVARQSRVAAYESETPGYNMLNLRVSYSTKLSGLASQLYLKAENLTDQLAYAHTSFIKNVAPLTGRNLTLGLRVSF